VRAANQQLNKDDHRNRPSAGRPLISLAVGIIAEKRTTKGFAKVGQWEIAIQRREY
jgi:hypothetical protein